jgi:hypothetical protein
MRCIKTGARAFECNVRQGGNKTVNLDEVEALWACDIYDCPACHMRIIGTFGEKPLFESHQKEEMKKYLATALSGQAQPVWFLSI